MREINFIILHCAATKPSMDIGVKEIRKWHVEERGWQDIGYHYVIRRDGTLEKGRDEAVKGAHCANHNYNSIGICLVGGMAQHSSKAEDNFLKPQFDTLAKLIRDLRTRYPLARICGHNEFANKDCPVFDVDKFLQAYELDR